jgi:hypothetical protein
LEQRSEQLAMGEKRFSGGEEMGNRYKEKKPGRT